MFLLYFVSILCVFILFVYYRVSQAYKYWERKGIKGPTPTFLIGNYHPIFTSQSNPIVFAKHIYDQYPNEKVVGIYQGLTPVLLVRCPEIIKTILVKESSAFLNRGWKVADRGILSKSIILAEGQEWNFLRKKLSPFFTISRLKQTMPILKKSTESFAAYLDEILEQPGSIDVRKVVIKYIIQSVVAVGFGLDIDTYTDEQSKFLEMTHRVLDINLKMRLSIILHSMKPGIVDLLGINVDDHEVNDFFLSVMNQVVQNKKETLSSNKDFIDYLIELKEKSDENKENGNEDYWEITNDVLVSQAITFFTGSYSSNSGSIYFLLYELAHNPDKQERCYQEIRNVMEKYNGQLSYEALNDMQYLNMALSEAMRKHPASGLVYRQCVHDYKFDDINLKVDKGVKIFIPVHGLHMDSEYFQEPTIFEPERFSPENVNKIRNFTYLPFGDGPRKCIARRFGEIQCLLGVAQFLLKARVEPSSLTPQPLEYHPRQITLTTAGPLWLILKRR